MPNVVNVVLALDKKNDRTLSTNAIAWKMKNVKVVFNISTESMIWMWNWLAGSQRSSQPSKLLCQRCNQPSKLQHVVPIFFLWSYCLMIWEIQDRFFRMMGVSIFGPIFLSSTILQSQSLLQKIVHLHLLPCMAGVIGKSHWVETSWARKMV